MAFVLWLAGGAPPPPPAAEAPLVYLEPAPPPPLGAPRAIQAEPEARPAPRRTPPPAPSAVPEGSAGGVPDGVVDGEAGGRVGGMVGGTGDAPVAADHVAHSPVVVARTLPAYPPAARMRGQEGQVVLRAVVDRDGRIEEAVTVVRSMPPFDAAAVDALRRWRFEPGRDADGRTVRVLLEVPIRFQLR